MTKCEAPSSSGLGRCLLKAKIRGSNPLGATQCKMSTFNSANGLIHRSNLPLRIAGIVPL